MLHRVNSGEVDKAKRGVKDGVPHPPPPSPVSRNESALKVARIDHAGQRLLERLIVPDRAKLGEQRDGGSEPRHRFAKGRNALRCAVERAEPAVGWNPGLRRCVIEPVPERSIVVGQIPGWRREGVGRTAGETIDTTRGRRNRDQTRRQ